MWLRPKATCTPGTWLIASMSSRVSQMRRPACWPAWGLLVFSPRKAMLLMAKNPMSSSTAFSSPRPNPSISTSMNTPQKIPQAVRNVRRRLRRSVCRIS